MARPPRLRDFDYRGRYAYFLTFCTFRRRVRFQDPAVATQILEQFRRTSRQFQFAILAYCVMPDHAHLLVHGTSAEADLRSFVKCAKQRTGQLYARVTDGPLWQEGYYDHVVRPEEDLARIARYIIENPVRAGLAPTPEDYPFVGSDTWSLEELLAGGQ